MSSERIPRPEPSTDDEREVLAEVIWESRIEFSSPGKTPATNWSDVAISAARQSARHTADRILAAGFRRQGPSTDEWEYGTEYEVSATESVFDVAHSRKQAQKWVDQSPTDTGLVRRRKAGPWEPIEGDAS